VRAFLRFMIDAVATMPLSFVVKHPASTRNPGGVFQSKLDSTVVILITGNPWRNYGVSRFDMPQNALLWTSLLFNSLKERAQIDEILAYARRNCDRNRVL